MACFRCFQVSGLAWQNRIKMQIWLYLFNIFLFNIADISTSHCLCYTRMIFIIANSLLIKKTQKFIKTKKSHLLGPHLSVRSPNAWPAPGHLKAGWLAGGVGGYYHKGSREVLFSHPEWTPSAQACSARALRGLFRGCWLPPPSVLKGKLDKIHLNWTQGHYK